MKHEIAGVKSWLVFDEQVLINAACVSESKKKLSFSLNFIAMERLHVSSACKGLNGYEL